MDTLEVKVSDKISVEDVFVEIVRFFQEVVRNFGGIAIKVEKELEVRSTDDSRGPPTLKVRAREVVNTSDKFGPR